MIKKYNHDEYMVDDTFKRGGLKREMVEDLTELEAKDLVCNLMDCITKITLNVTLNGRKVADIAEEHGFVV
jgi:hypothetical protein